MKEITFSIENKVGKMADLCEQLSRSGINIKSMVSASDSVTKIHIITSDEETTKNILEKKKIKYSVDEILALRMPDRPGELAKITRKLANAKIPVDFLYLIGKEGNDQIFALKLKRMNDAKIVLKSFIGGII